MEVLMLVNHAGWIKKLRLGIFLAQCAALVWMTGWLSGAQGVLNGFPLDDAWIHQVVARTFANTGTLGYAPGHYGAGATSFLWSALLAINFKFLAVSPPFYAFVLNAALYLVAGQLWFTVLLGTSRRVVGEERLKACSFGVALATCAGVCGGNVLWFAFSGMEVLLLVALSLSTVVLASGPQRTRPLLVAGLCAGLAGLSRPEAFSFGIFLFILVWFFGRSRHNALLVLPGWGFCAGFYFTTNLMLTGSVMPTTLAGRKWMWLEENLGLSFTERGVDFLDVWVTRLREYTLGTPSTLVFWISGGLCIAGTAALLRRSDARLRIALGWMLLHSLTFFILLPTPGHGGRYQPWLPLYYATSLIVGAELFAASMLRFFAQTEGYRKLFVLIICAPWLALMIIGVRNWGRNNQYAVQHIDRTERAMGRVVDRLPADAVVASFDIGGIGFEAHRPIVDIGGLSNQRFAELFTQGKVAQYMRSAGITHVVLPLPYDESLPVALNFGFRLHLKDNPEVVLERIADLYSDFPTWFPSVGATWNASPRQVLHAVSYTSERPVFSSAPSLDAVDLVFGDVYVPGREKSRLIYALRVLRESGVRVALGVGVSPRVRLVDGRTIELGIFTREKRVTLNIPNSEQTESALLADEIHSKVMAAVAPFFDVNDDVGAAHRSLHVLAAELTRANPGAIRPMLPPARFPASDGITSRDWSTLSWGLPLMFSVTMLVGLLTFEAKRRLRGD